MIARALIVIGLAVIVVDLASGTAHTPTGVSLLGLALIALGLWVNRCFGITLFADEETAAYYAHADFEIEHGTTIPARRALADFPPVEHLGPCVGDCDVCGARR